MRVELYLAVAVLASPLAAYAQQSGSPAIVQPGAPGQPSSTLSAAVATRDSVRAPSSADIRFMQDMIMHHGQAIQMTDLAKTRAKDPEVQDIARKIDLSQGDEIRWMKQWLTDRGIPIETMDNMSGMAMSGAGNGSMAGMDHSKMDHSQMAGMDHSNMPGMNHGAAAVDPQDVAPMIGMLTPRQMTALRNSTGAQFDTLFLTGMMQHHGGAIVMVKQLLDTPGSAQEGQLFDFANDVDNTQLAEINIMNGILRKVNP